MLDISQMDLRELARAYSGGLLDFEQYRRARTQLLDRATGDATIMVQHPPRSAEPDSMPALVDESVTKRRLYRPTLFSSLVVLVVVFVLLVWLVIG